jgi:hypothetical protein
MMFCGGDSEDFIFLYFQEGYRAKLIIQWVLKITISHQN